jgi:ketosteroid isomerase-like protein
MTVDQNLVDGLWSREVAYWEYAKAADLTSYLSLWHEDVVAWPNNQPSPIDKDSLRQIVDRGLASIQFKSVDLKPLSVRIYGDTGIVYYEVNSVAITKDGTEIATHERLTHTWLQTQNGWKIIGGMSAPLARS